MPGKLVVVAALVLGVAAGSLAWWYRFAQTRQALAYWGGAEAQLILAAPQVEWHALTWEAPRISASNPGPGGAVPEALVPPSPAGFELNQAERLELSLAPGVGNMRQALVTDRNLQFGTNPATPPQWSHALRFADEQGETWVQIDLAAGWLQSPHRDFPVRLVPKVAQGLAVYVQETAASQGKNLPAPR